MESFHSIALAAFVEVAQAAGDWPDSRAVQRLAYALYERELRTRLSEPTKPTTREGRDCTPPDPTPPTQRKEMVMQCEPTPYQPDESTEGNHLALLRSLPDVVAEYEQKREAIPQAIADFEQAGTV